MAKNPKQQYRIRYVKNWHDDGEYYLFEWKWPDEPDTEWTLDCGCKLFDYKGEKGALVSYQAITKIRELLRNGISIWFC